MTIETKNIEFEPQIFSRSLARNIVVVARTRIEGSWKAYIGSTDEGSHKDAIPDILAYGTAVTESLARTIFPLFKDVPYAR